MKNGKYKQKRPTIDGIQFDSNAEGVRYTILKQKAAAGLISDLQLQVKYDLEVAGFKVCSYIADFAYKVGGKEIVEDVKGIETPLFRLKYKLMYACHGIKVLITKAIYKQKNKKKFIAGFKVAELKLPKKVKKGKNERN